MTQGADEYSCPVGFPVERLMEYLEGDAGRAARDEVERHLEKCPDCAAEMERLRKMDALLSSHPFVFHPDPDDLHAYSTRGADPNGLIAEHTAVCAECREMVLLFKETAADSTARPRTQPRMPESLHRELESIYPGSYGASASPSRLRGVLDRLRHSFSAPNFAFGAAVAVILVAVLVLPFWRTWEDHARDVARPLPEEAPVIERPSLETQEGVDSGKGEAYERFDAAKEAPGRPETRDKTRSLRPARRESEPSTTADRSAESAPSAPRPVVEESPPASSMSGAGREEVEVVPPSPPERRSRSRTRAGKAADASAEPNKRLRNLEERVGVARKAKLKAEVPLGYRATPSRESPAPGAPRDRAPALSDKPRAPQSWGKGERWEGALEAEALSAADKEKPPARFSVDLDVKRVGGRYTITVRLIDSATGEEVGRVQEEGVSPEELGNRAAIMVRSVLEQAVDGQPAGRLR